LFKIDTLFEFYSNYNLILFLAPYKPLLDRQLYFAAHSLPAQNPWLMSVLYRLLNNQKEVLSLLNTNQMPFGKNPPKFVKVSLYKYQFSSKLQRYVTNVYHIMYIIKILISKI